MKSFKHLNKFLFMACAAGLLFFFQSCGPAYVSVEPVSVEVSRPASPGNAYIWVEGDWVWSRQSRTYVRGAGHWERPNQGRVFVPGHWQSSPRGYYWVQGHWERQRR